MRASYLYCCAKKLLIARLSRTLSPRRRYFIYFMNYVQEDVICKSKSLDTGIVLMERDGHLYLVRDLVNSAFVPYAATVSSMMLLEFSSTT